MARTPSVGGRLWQRRRAGSWHHQRLNVPRGGPRERPRKVEVRKTPRRGGREANGVLEAMKTGPANEGGACQKGKCIEARVNLYTRGEKNTFPSDAEWNLVG